MAVGQLCRFCALYTCKSRGIIFVKKKGNKSFWMFSFSSSCCLRYILSILSSSVELLVYYRSNWQKYLHINQSKNLAESFSCNRISLIGFVFSCTKDEFSKIDFGFLSKVVKCFLPTKVVCHWRASYIDGRIILMVVLYWWLSSIDGLLPLKDPLPLKEILFQQLSVIKSCLPSKDVFLQRLFSIKVSSFLQSSSFLRLSWGRLYVWGVKNLIMA